MQYSIVIPAHNEGPVIESFVTRFLDELPPAVKEVLLEVIVVENGSTDDTLEACRRLEQARPGCLRALTIPRGSYGEAIKHGMLQSRGTHLSILECDFLDPSFVEQSVRLFGQGGARVIVASKRHRGSVDRRPWKRKLLTMGFNRLLNLFTGYPGSDTHGLKSLETGLARRLCELAETTDEVFQTEIILLAWKLGETICELPIRIEERRAPAVSIRRRVPKVMHFIRQLRRSLGRLDSKPGRVRVVDQARLP